MSPATMSSGIDNVEGAAELSAVLARHAGAVGDHGCLHGCGRPHHSEELDRLPHHCEPFTSETCPHPLVNCIRVQWLGTLNAALSTESINERPPHLRPVQCWRSPGFLAWHPQNL